MWLGLYFVSVLICLVFFEHPDHHPSVTITGVLVNSTASLVIGPFITLILVLSMFSKPGPR